MKKQIAEVFRSYFYDRKKNRMRSKGSIILWFAFFILLMVGVLGGMFTFLAIGICPGLASVGMGWLYFAMMSGIAIVLGAFGSVFNTYSGLYLPKDNDLLLSMPIPARLIIISRLLNVYLLGTMYAAVVMLSTLIVYWTTVGVTVGNLIGGILLFLIVTLIVLMLSCLLGWVVAKISVKLKNKSFITVFISLAFIGAYYFIYFKAQEWIKDLLANAVLYGANIKNNAYMLYLFGSIGEGNRIAMLAYSGIMIALLAATLAILSHSFLKVATASGGAKKVKYKEKSVREKSVFSALLMKEFARFTSSPTYMLNCGLGVLLIPAVGVFLLIKGADIMTVLRSILPAIPGCGEIIVCAALMTMTAMVDTAAPSVSLEGKNVWILQSLPVRPKNVLAAKTAVQLILSEIPILFSVCCAAIILPSSVTDKLLVCLLPLIFAAFSALFGVFEGVKRPILEWTTDMVPIKQSGAVAIVLFGGWGLVAVFAVPYFFFGYHIGLTAYLAIWSAIYAAASVLLARWLNTKGAEAFARL